MAHFTTLTDILYQQYTKSCQSQLAQYIQHHTSDDASPQSEHHSSPHIFQYCILQPFMRREFQGLNAEEIVKAHQRDSSNSLTHLEEAIYNGEYQFGELLKYDKRSLSHVQYVTSFCGSKYVDEYMHNNCHVKALQGESCDEIRRDVSDCVTNLACDKIRDSLIECYTDLKRFDQATLVQLMVNTKDLQYGSMKEAHCGLVLRDMLYCVDKYTVLGAVMKTDRRMGSMRYAPLDEETYRNYKQFARREAKRRREEMMESYV